MQDFYDLTARIMKLVDSYDGEEFLDLRYFIDNKGIIGKQEIRDVQGDHGIVCMAEYPGGSSAYFQV